jgi:hypothetical protein
MNVIQALRYCVLQCTKTCEKGEKRREVVCADLVRQVEVGDAFCQAKPKPKDRQACNKQPCPFRWVPGDWSQVQYLLKISKKTSYLVLYVEAVKLNFNFQ